MNILIGRFNGSNYFTFFRTIVFRNTEFFYRSYLYQPFWWNVSLDKIIKFTSYSFGYFICVENVRSSMYWTFISSPINGTPSKQKFDSQCNCVDSHCFAWYAFNWQHRPYKCVTRCQTIIYYIRLDSTTAHLSQCSCCHCLYSYMLICFRFL